MAKKPKTSADEPVDAPAEAEQDAGPKAKLIDAEKVLDDLIANAEEPVCSYAHGAKTRLASLIALL